MATTKLPCDKHFQKPGHSFTKHARFTVIAKTDKISESKIELRKLLQKKEDIWMLHLETITAKSLSIRLNYTQDITGRIT